MLPRKTSYDLVNLKFFVPFGANMSVQLSALHTNVELHPFETLLTKFQDFRKDCILREGRLENKQNFLLPSTVGFKQILFEPVLPYNVQASSVTIKNELDGSKLVSVFPK